MTLRGLALLLLVSACHPAETTAKIDPNEEAWWRVLDQRRADGSVSVDTARAAFTLAIGPLPGVGTPPGVIAPIASGTIAVRWILAHYDELTSAQRQVVDSYLQVVGKADHPGPGDCSGDPSTFAMLINAASSSIAGQLGLSAIPIATCVNLNNPPGDAGAALAYAIANDSSPNFGTDGAFARCTISINQKNVGSFSAGEQMQAAYHEAFHCYEARMSPTLKIYYKNLPDWIIEGAAQWVAAKLTGHAEYPYLDGMPNGSWRRCLTNLPQSLYTLTYDGLCFFSQVDARGRSPFTYVDAMITAFVVESTGTFHSGSDAAFTTATGSDDFLDSWASSFARLPGLGPDWDFTGPAITMDQPKPLAGSIGNGDPPFTGEVPEGGNQLGLIDLSAEVVSIRVSPHARMRSLMGNGPPASPFGDWCVSASSCVCPDTSARAGQTLEMLPPDSYYLAVTGGRHGGNWLVQGSTLDDYCNSDRVNPCVRGNWTLDTAGPLPESIDYDCEEPLTIGTRLSIDKSGAVLEDLDPSGTLTCKSVSDVVTVKLSGQESGTVEARLGYLTGTITSSSVTISGSLDGVDVSGLGASLLSALGSSSSGAVTYQCSGSQLVLSAPNGISYRYSR